MIVAVAVLISALATGLTLRVLRAPVLILLTELCVLEYRALFWWRVVAAQVVFGTALFLSLAALGTAGDESWRLAAGLMRGALAGLLLTVLTVTAGVLVFELQSDRR